MCPLMLTVVELSSEMKKRFSMWTEGSFFYTLSSVRRFWNVHSRRITVATASLHSFPLSRTNFSLSLARSHTKKLFSSTHRFASLLFPASPCRIFHEPNPFAVFPFALWRPSWPLSKFFRKGRFYSKTRLNKNSRSSGWIPPISLPKSYQLMKIGTTTTATLCLSEKRSADLLTDLWSSHRTAVRNPCFHHIVVQLGSTNTNPIQLKTDRPLSLLYVFIQRIKWNLRYLCLQILSIFVLPNIRIQRLHSTLFLCVHLFALPFFLNHFFFCRPSQSLVFSFTVPSFLPFAVCPHFTAHAHFFYGLIHVFW